ncbi:MAG: hypothetical protein WC914_08685 [Proteiniphilum sp.]
MDTSSSFSDRLTYLQDLLEIDTGRSFAKKIGITHGNLQSYKKGSQPRLDKLINILTSVEDLNPVWLLYGEGEVFIVKEKEEEKDNSDEITSRLISIIESQQRTIESQQNTCKDLLNQKESLKNK